MTESPTVHIRPHGYMRGNLHPEIWTKKADPWVVVLGQMPCHSYHIRDNYEPICLDNSVKVGDPGNNTVAEIINLTSKSGALIEISADRNNQGRQILHSRSLVKVVLKQLVMIR